MIRGLARTRAAWCGLAVLIGALPSCSTKLPPDGTPPRERFQWAADKYDNAKYGDAAKGFLDFVGSSVVHSVGGWLGLPALSLEQILGTLLAPLAWLMGVPWEDAAKVGSFMGVKTVLNEFLAYQQLADAVAAGELGERSAVIASYALCGFANFGSLAILLGGIGGLCPERRPEVASLGLRCILSGSLATFMTACVAGMLL